MKEKGFLRLLKSVFQECPETPMALTLLLIEIIFLPLGKISILFVSL